MTKFPKPECDTRNCSRVPPKHYSGIKIMKGGLKFAYLVVNWEFSNNSIIEIYYLFHHPECKYLFNHFHHNRGSIKYAGEMNKFIEIKKMRHILSLVQQGVEIIQFVTLPSVLLVFSVCFFDGFAYSTNSSDEFIFFQE